MIGYGNFLFRHRNWVFPLVMILLFGAFRPVPAGGEAAADLWLDIAGIAVVLAGLALRGAVVGLAYIKRGGLQKKVYADDLVTTGMFAHGRNPLYVGNALMIAGYLMIHNNPWVYALGGLFFGTAYHAIVAAEEVFLRAKFGAAYEAYCRDVPRWSIRLVGLSRTFAGMEFNWRRVVAKDYSTAVTAAITVLALLAWQTLDRYGIDAARGPLLLYGVLLLAVPLAGIAISRAKKRGWLKV